MLYKRSLTAFLSQNNGQLEKNILSVCSFPRTVIEVSFSLTREAGYLLLFLKAVPCSCHYQVCQMSLLQVQVPKLYLETVIAFWPVTSSSLSLLILCTGVGPLEERGIYIYTCLVHRGHKPQGISPPYYWGVSPRPYI